MDESKKETIIKMQNVHDESRSHVVRDDYLYNDNDDAGKFTIFARYVIMALVILISIILFPITIFMSAKVVRQYERAVLFRLGKLSGKKAKGPGLFFTIPLLDNIVVVDMRTKNFDIPKQEVLTKDSVTISVDAVLYSSVFDPIWSVTKVEDATSATVVLAATTLRNMVATLSLSEFLTSRERIANEMQHQLDLVTDQWGLKLERVEITDVQLPKQMQRAMAAEAEADRDAKAKIIAAEGEKQASSALKQAADIISTSPMALQLRYLQTLNAISQENNSTIVFPIPIEMLSTFTRSNTNSKNSEL